MSFPLRLSRENIVVIASPPYWQGGPRFSLAIHFRIQKTFPLYTIRRLELQAGTLKGRMGNSGCSSFTPEWSLLCCVWEDILLTTSRSNSGTSFLGRARHWSYCPASVSCSILPPGLSLSSYSSQVWAILALTHLNGPRILKFAQLLRTVVKSRSPRKKDLLQLLDPISV